MGHIANSFLAFILIFGLTNVTALYFTEFIGFATSINVHAPPGIKVTPVFESTLRGINCIPRYTPAYIQLWITNTLNKPVEIYNLTILPSDGYTEIVQVCDYAPYINAYHIPAQELNGILEPNETVILLVAYKLNYTFYFGSINIILHANTTA